MHARVNVSTVGVRARPVQLNGDCVGPLSWLFGDPVASAKFLERCSDQIQRIGHRRCFELQAGLPRAEAYAQRLSEGK